MVDFQALAARLRDHADSIVDLDQHQMEEDIRAAADTIANIDMALIPRLIAVIRGAAEHCHDVPIRALLYALIGHRA